MRQIEGARRGIEGTVDEGDFEGTVVLELLAEVGCVDEFFDAVDGDDLGRAARLMRLAGVDEETAGVVLRKMVDGDDD